MAFPANTGLIVMWLRGIPRRSFSWGQDAGGINRILEWDLAYGPEPTESEVIAAATDPACQAYIAEHGGDPNLTKRREAKELFDGISSVALRAALIELILYARDAHLNLNTLLDGIAAANNLADIKTTAAGITQQPAPTNNTTLLNGAKASIRARIDAGEADN